MELEEKASLRGAAFVDRELVGLDMSGADLRDAQFEKTLVVGCDLSGADLRGARFFLCELRGVVLNDAVLGDNQFVGTTVVDPVGVSPTTQALLEEWGATFQPRHASRR